MANPLAALLSLPDAEKQSRGLTNTPREIFQQPETWLLTLDHLAAARAELKSYFQEFLASAGAGFRPEIILTGAGTSDYIGRAVSRPLRKHLPCEVSAIPSTELLTNLDDFVVPDKQYLLVSFSRSGDSSEGVAVLHQTSDRFPRQIRHLLVTCNKTGTMATFPGIFSLVLDSRVNDRGLAMTSSFTNMVIAGQSLAFLQEPEIFESFVRAISAAGSRKMAEAATITAELASRHFSRVCFLGTGSQQAVAEESALKVLELNAGKIATLAQSPLGLRHGPLSFVNDETLVVAYLSADEQRRQYEIDLLEELRTKHLGADMLVITPHPASRIDRLTKHVLSLDLSPGFPDFALAPISVIAGQLLGLFFSIENGITPDSPSSGAITRVVSHVKIYSPNQKESLTR